MILITGATGHIGINFVLKLVEEKEPFSLLVRNIPSYLTPYQKNCIVGDISDLDFLKSNLHEGDTLVHLAGIIDFDNSELDDCILINDFTTRQMVDLCIERNIHFIYTSSVDVFDRNKNHGFVTEKNPIITTTESNYTLTKASATRYLKEKMETSNIQATLFYPTAIFGAKDYKPSRAGEEIIKSKDKLVIPYIAGGYNFIDVKDVACYLYEAIQYRITGDYILGAWPVTIKEMLKLVKKIEKRKALFIYIPKWMSYLGTYLTNRVTKLMLHAIYDNYQYDTTKALETFHVDLTPYQDTMKQFLEETI